MPTGAEQKPLSGSLFWRRVQVPLATVEGALIASTRRGCKAITECGGASARVLKQARLDRKLMKMSDECIVLRIAVSSCVDPC